MVTARLDDGETPPRAERDLRRPPLAPVGALPAAARDAGGATVVLGADRRDRHGSDWLGAVDQPASGPGRYRSRSRRTLRSRCFVREPFPSVSTGTSVDGAARGWACEGRGRLGDGRRRGGVRRRDRGRPARLRVGHAPADRRCGAAAAPGPRLRRSDDQIRFRVQPARPLHRVRDQREGVRRGVERLDRCSECGRVAGRHAALDATVDGAERQVLARRLVRSPMLLPEVERLHARVPLPGFSSRLPGLRGASATAPPAHGPGARTGRIVGRVHRDAPARRRLPLRQERTWTTRTRGTSRRTSPRPAASTC